MTLIMDMIPTNVAEAIGADVQRSKQSILYCKFFSKMRRIGLHQQTLLHKMLNPCKGCGEKRISLLTFHHRNPNEKDFDVSQVAKSVFSYEKAELEIAKCDVYCLDCHRNIHSISEKSQ